MTRDGELSDADVWGARVVTEKRGELSDADVWGAPAAQAEPEGVSLGERFATNFVEAFTSNPIQVADRALSRFVGNVLPSSARRAEFADQQRRDASERFEVLPSFTEEDGIGNQFVAGLTSLVGQIGGAVTDPTSFVGSPAAGLARQFGVGAAVNAAADAPAQFDDMRLGIQEGFDPARSAMAGLLGGTLSATPGAIGALRDWWRSRNGTDPNARDPIDDMDDAEFEEELRRRASRDSAFNAELQAKLAEYGAPDGTIFGAPGAVGDLGADGRPIAPRTMTDRAAEPAPNSAQFTEKGQADIAAALDARRARDAEEGRSRPPVTAEDAPAERPNAFQERRARVANDREVERLRAERLATAAVEIDPAAASTAGRRPSEPEAPIEVDAQGGAARVTPEVEAGRAAAARTKAEADAAAERDFRLAEKAGDYTRARAIREAQWLAADAERKRQEVELETLAVRGPAGDPDATLGGERSIVDPATARPEEDGDAFGRPQAGSRVTGGTGDRPFVEPRVSRDSPNLNERLDADADSANAEFFRQRAETKAEAERLRTAEDLEREWARRARDEQARGRQNEDARARTEERARGEFDDDPGPAGGDGFWRVNDDGILVGKTGRPVRFRSQKVAARWAAKNGQGAYFDQVAGRTNTTDTMLRARDAFYRDRDGVRNNAEQRRQSSGAATLPPPANRLASPERMSERPIPAEGPVEPPARGPEPEPDPDSPSPTPARRRAVELAPDERAAFRKMAAREPLTDAEEATLARNGWAEEDMSGLTPEGERMLGTFESARRTPPRQEPPRDQEPLGARQVEPETEQRMNDGRNAEQVATDVRAEQTRRDEAAKAAKREKARQAREDKKAAAGRAAADGAREALDRAEEATRRFPEAVKPAAAETAKKPPQTPRNIDTPAFKEWFGDSHAVNPDGTPQTLYHATSADFDTFKPGGNNPDVSGPAIWLTSNKNSQPAAHNLEPRMREVRKKTKQGIRTVMEEVPGDFAGGQFRTGSQVMPVYARIENPLVVDGGNRSSVNARWGNQFPQILTKENVADLKAEGRDGIILKQEDGTDEIVVFDANQVKSKHNSGEFSRLQGSTTLHSNPIGPMLDYLLDFDAWKDSARSLGKLAKEVGERSGSRPDGQSAVGATWRSVVDSLDSRLRAIIERGGNKSEAATKIADDLFARSGSGAASSVRGTYTEAVTMRANRQATIVQRIADAIDALEKAGSKIDGERLIKMVENPVARRGDAGKIAKQIEDFFKEHADYLKEAGVEIGEVKNYFRRAYDSQKIDRDRDGFITAASRAYRLDGLAKDKVEADQMANAFYFSQVFGPLGKPGELRGPGKGQPFHSRVFSPRAAKLLDKYRNTDVVAVMSSYAATAARRAEVARRFGDNWKDWPALEQKIRDEGGAGAIPALREAAETTAGLNNMSTSGAVNLAGSLIRSVTTLQLLSRVFFTSVAEPLVTVSQTGDYLDGVRAFSNTFKAFFLRGTTSEKAWAELAEDLGIIMSEGSSGMMAARWAGGEPTTKAEAAVLSSFFRGIQMEQLTNSGRIAGMRSAVTFLQRLAKEHATDPDRAAFFMRDLGVTDAIRPAFLKMMKEIGKDVPSAATLAKHGDAGRALATAMMRMSDRTIQNPSASTRPGWASHPFGKVIFQLRAFGMAFEKNVLLRPNEIRKSVNRGELAKGNNETGKAYMALLAGAMLPLAIVHAATSDLRSMLSNPERHERETAGFKLERGLSYSGILGKFDPVYQLIGGTRYGATAVDVGVGPGLGLFAKWLASLMGFAANNSPATNAAERTAVRETWRYVFEPMAQTALAVIPVGPQAAILNQAIAFGTRALGVRAAGDHVTDRVAGPAQRQSNDEIEASLVKAWESLRGIVGQAATKKSNESKRRGGHAKL